MTAATARVLSTVLVLFQLALPHAPLAAAEVYKWKDAAGHLHFGDKPPGSAVQAESLTIRSSAPAAADGQRQERLRQLLDSYASERKAQDASRAAARREVERREQACIRARARQQRAERTNVMYVRKPGGERRVLDGAEHQHVIDKARQAVADSCD